MTSAQACLKDSDGNILCFKHAVQKVVKEDEDISIEVDAAEDDPNDYT